MRMQSCEGSFTVSRIIQRLLFEGSFFLLAHLLFLPLLNAGLVLDPTGLVFFDGFDRSEEDTAKRVTGLNFRFYGTDRSEIWVSENGNLNFSADGSFSPTLLGAPSHARIAPLWDDFLLLQGEVPVNNRVLVDHQSGRWLSVTWENVRLFHETAAGEPFPDTTRSAQVVIFESDQLIRGFEFRRNDIAFGHIPHELGTSNFGWALEATVGIDSGNGVFSAIPGTSAGRITDANDDLLSWESDSFILFRPTDSIISGYDASKQLFSAVPEPTSVSLALVVLVVVGVVRGRVHNKR